MGLIPEDRRLHARHRLARLLAQDGPIDIAEAALLVAAEEYPDLDIDQWLLVHPDMRRTARIRAFVQHLTLEFEAQRDLIEGRRGPHSIAP